jgi:hypothetical protein
MRLYSSYMAVVRGMCSCKCMACISFVPLICRAFLTSEHIGTDTK